MMKASRKHFRKVSSTIAIRIFLVMFGTAGLCCFGFFIALRLGISLHDSSVLLQIFEVSIVWMLVGSILSSFFIRKPLKPLDVIFDAQKKVSGGDFSVRLNVPGPYLAREYMTSFNQMVKELESIEILRSDFVNNFSHEFKTPIVSINGFARMLKRDDLSPEEREEYLDIIIDESDRLAELSTSVLTLSKLENQHIITDKKEINISEQLRVAIALLEKKWRKKNLQFEFDSEEVYTSGNEEMLKQVWINLIDNAIKFSPDFGTITVEVQDDQNSVTVFVSNEGTISQEEQSHIFDRFYQTDKNRSKQGIGLGLAITQKIIDLHNGEMHVQNKDAAHVEFEVKL